MNTPNIKKKGPVELTVPGKLVKRQLYSHAGNRVFAGANYLDSQDRLTKQCLKAANCNTRLGVSMNDEVLRSYTCKFRWCSHCNSHRGMVQRLRYAPAIEAIYKESQEKNVGGGRVPGLFFVTLTVPNVYTSALKETLGTMALEWTRMYKLAHELKRPYFKGLRKLEVSASEPLLATIEKKVLRAVGEDKVPLRARIADLKSKRADLAQLKEGHPELHTPQADPKLHAHWQELVRSLYWYHPHYHILVQGKANAIWLRSQWLKRFPRAHRKGQDIRPYYEKQTAEGKTKNGLYEMMKYIAKSVDAKGMAVSSMEYACAIGYVYRLLVNKQTLNAFGGIKKVSEAELDELLKEKIGHTADIEGLAEVNGRAYLLKERPDLTGKWFFWSQKKANFLAKDGSGALFARPPDFDLDNPEHIDPKEAAQFRQFGRDGPTTLKQIGRWSQLMEKQKHHYGKVKTAPKVKKAARGKKEKL